MLPLVVVAWIFHGGKVLLVHHRKIGRWLPVGGHVEEGEDLLSALRREIAEEVGLEVVVLGPPPILPDVAFSKELPLPFRVATYGDELTFDFIARTDDTSVVLQESELLGARWLSLEEIQGSAEYTERVKLLAARAFELYGGYQDGFVA